MDLTNIVQLEFNALHESLRNLDERINDIYKLQQDKFLNPNQETELELKLKDELELKSAMKKRIKKLKRYLTANAVMQYFKYNDK